MQKNNQIAHISDVHIRKGIRHNEYEQVFEKLYEDLKKEKPRRIVITGDLFHNKIDMSPNLISLASSFLLNLAQISPVDIIPGNHDLNLSQLSQGDSIKSLVSLFNIGHIIENDKEDINFNKKYDQYYSIYYFPYSGYYKIDDDLVYGHYSCIDNEILTLKEKEENIKYVALFHGQVYQSMNDNGSLNLDTSLLKTSSFNNFDIVMLGDVHEHQTFREDESMAYAGSLIQNGFGESIEKGYLIWDLESNVFRFKYIPNDWGFAKINISIGESWEERLNNIKFSNDKKKTKVHVEVEEYEENQSVEKENQIIHFLKDNFGCERVDVDFLTVFKDYNINSQSDEAEEEKERDINELIREFLDNQEEEYDEEIKEKVIELSKQTDQDLEIEPLNKYKNVSWYIESMDICNVFSFGTNPIHIPFDKIRGITGIFGQNYTGKSNFIKAMVWGLFQYVLGNGTPKEIVNIYTDSDKGYVNINLVISGVKYNIYRSIRNKTTKNGEVKNEYEVSYKVYDQNPLTGEYEWMDEINDKSTNDKKAVKDLIEESIGTASDFAKVNLQSETGNDNFLNSNQQDQNAIVRKYLGLQHFSDRYDYIKKKFNEITKERKKLGDIKQIQDELKETQDHLNNLENNRKQLQQEKTEKENIVDSINNEILSLTSQMEKIEDIPEKSETLEIEINNIKERLQNEQKEYNELNEWLSNNYRKELSENINESLEELNEQLKKKREDFNDKKEKYKTGEEWLNNNPQKEEIDTSQSEKRKEEINNEINKLSDKLPSLRGKKCPTCGSIQEKPQPQKEQECLDRIETLKKEREEIENKIKEANENKEHNIKFEKAQAKLETLKSSLTNLKNEIEEIKRKIHVLEQSQDIIEHNKIFDQKNEKFNNLRNSIDNKKEGIREKEEKLNKIKENEKKKEYNKQFEKQIEEKKEKYNEEKKYLQNLEKQINDLTGEIRIQNKNVENYEEKINSIKDKEKEFKVYSLYLQAVHRDGIPAQIIRKKIPVINSKIRSILKDVVEYNLEISIDNKGDIKKYFYYNNDKSDILSLESSSGSQGFFANLAIRDALHYVSKLPKSSMCVIDEGFGKLDEDKTINMEGPLNYLKNKYRNVFIVTHKNIIKDFVDNVIMTSRSSDGINEDTLQKHPNAWTTHLDIN